MALWLWAVSSQWLRISDFRPTLFSGQLDGCTQLSNHGAVATSLIIEIWKLNRKSCKCDCRFMLCLFL